MIVLDTNILIYAAKSHAPEHPRAAALMQAIGERHVPTLLPTIVIAEYLAGVPMLDHGTHLTALAGVGQIVPFDIRAAAIAARIQGRKDAVQEATKATGNRRLVTSDVKVLATAIANNALHLYTRDSGIQHMRRLISGLYQIGISGIPENPGEQLGLFFSKEV